MSFNVSRRDFIGLGAGALAAGCSTARRYSESPHVPGTGKIPYRVFWTWDNSHNWCENVVGSQTAGIGDAYTKRGEWFERDYKRSIDWCAQNGIDAIGVVGMLRDAHGGVDSARRICGYAREKGIRIYLISGLYTYGGVYYEGNSHWSMERWFAQNKDAIGRRRNGSLLQFRQHGHNGSVSQYVGCPASEKLNRYMLDSLEWVFKAIPELGGIQMETGDTQVCWCDKCRARRGEGAIVEDMSVEDMLAAYPTAADAVWSVNPDAWVMCETYHHFNDEACRAFFAPDAEKTLAKIAAMPEKTFWQWKCDRQLAGGTWKYGDELPPILRKFRHMMRAHSGTQWWGGRAAWAVDKIREQCRLSYGSNICGVSLFGEISPYRTNAELNYLALSYFADNPEASLSAFGRDVMAPLLGGEEFAEKYILYAPYQDDPKRIASALTDIAKFVPSISDRHARRRWMWLADYLAAFRWNADHFPAGREHPRYTHVSPQV